MSSFFRSLSEKHEAFKKRVHGFRIPLSRRGIMVAKVCYFSVPVAFGYFVVMPWTMRRAEENLGERAEAIRGKFPGRENQAKMQFDEMMRRNKIGEFNDGETR